jgi:hypothetical protein
MSIVEAEVVQERPRPWGLWATIGLSMLIGAAFLGVQVPVAIAYIALAKIASPAATLEEIAAGAETNGLLLAVAAWAVVPVCVGLSVLFARLRRPWSAREYLGLRPVSPGRLGVWLAATIALTTLADLLTYLLGREVVPQAMTDTYRTAGWPPLFWSALVVAAPLAEETFFRGFAFRGLQASRIGTFGAIALTALCWAGMHLQYDLYQVSHIFVGGILLGLARAHTRSTYTPLAMHALWNLIATIEVWWVVNR